MDKNTIIVGKMGCGKTVLSTQLAIEDVEEGLKILIIDNHDEYEHKFLNYDLQVTDIYYYDKNFELEFENTVNIVKIDNLPDSQDANLSSILKAIFKYAEKYEVDTIYIDELMATNLLENISEYTDYENCFKIVAVTHGLLNIKNPKGVRHFFKDIMAMRLNIADIDCLKDNYLIRKRSLNECIDCARGYFTLYNLD